MEEEKKVDETQEKEESYIIDPKQQELDELNDRYKRVIKFKKYIKSRHCLKKKGSKLKWEKL